MVRCVRRAPLNSTEGGMMQGDANVIMHMNKILTN